MLRLRGQDVDAWNLLVRVYYPLVRTWCERAKVPASDIADVAQEVFRAVAAAIARYDSQRQDATFRGWLFGITRRQLLSYWRNQSNEPVGEGGTSVALWFQELSDENTPKSSLTDEVGDRILVLRQALELIRNQVEEKTWMAFWQVAVEGKEPAEVAEALGMKVATLYVVKGRMLRRLRDILSGLVD